MKRIWIYILFISLSSCDFFTTKDTQKEKLLQDAFESIDWSDVDQYPLFEDCDETNEKAIQRECFEATLVNYIFTCLDKTELEVEKELVDTVNVDFLIDNQGNITIQTIEKKPEVINQIPNLDALITNCLSQLPAVQPALKRSIPVAAKFRLPIIINVQ